uniref:PUL domain-containing protein n=1 Tax=Acrobeloides nanus TaxID=290746 RepID=A0A914C0W8_9BILA
MSGQGGGDFADPLTGGGRYVPGSGGENMHVKGPIDKKRPRSDLVPLRENFIFGYEGSSAKALEKLMENNQLQAEPLDAQELEALAEIFKNGDYAVTDAHVSALKRGLDWHLSNITPILDVFRLALLNPSLNNVFCSIHEGHGTQTLQRLTNLLVSEPPDPVRILVCRAFTNAASYESGREMLRRDFTTHVSLLVSQIKILKPAVQLAATSALANLSLILLRETEQGDVMELGPREDALRAVISGTENIQNFGDYSQPALIRLMQTIATLMWGDSSVIKLSKDREVATIVNRIRDAVSEDAGKRLALDILGMIWAV